MRFKHTPFLKKTAVTLTALLTMAIAGYAQTNYYVSPSGNDGNSGLSGFPKKTIQAAVNTAAAGDIINVDAGNYNEDVLINKQLSLLGSGHAFTVVYGPIGGGSSTIQVAAAGVIIDGFTITRDGNTVADWNNSGLNLAGIAVQGQSASAEIRNNRVFGNRNGIDINNSNGNNIHNNIIENNRTGIIFRNQTDNSNVQQNFITGNWTLGILFLDASGGSNVPVQTAVNSNFNNNNISGNWYGDVVDRQTGGSLPAPGNNMKNFECNWYGAASAPVVTTNNSTEPGYAAQIPVFYGGTATAPGVQPNIAGPASANIDYITWLSNGTDNSANTGFQPMPNSCNGCPSGNVVQNTNTSKFYCSIQEAINDPATLAGHTIVASAGTYNENITINKSVTLQGANYNASCNTTRGAETIINGSGGSNTATITVTADGVGIQGFTITNHNGSFGILIKGKSYTSIDYNIVTDVGNNTTGSGPSFGIYDQMPQAIGQNQTWVHVSNNCISDIRGGQNTSLTGAAARSNNGSGAGIGFGDSQTQSDLGGVLVYRNSVHHISACSSNFTDGGKGAYAVIMNVGASASAVGRIVNPSVLENTMHDLEGWWAHAVGLEGETPGAMVQNNFVYQLVDHKGGDAAGVFVESNAGAGTVNIHENSFTNMTYGVVNLMTDAVNATCNWYGSAAPATVTASNPGAVIYTPWTTSGIDASMSTPGFQPQPGSCNGNANAPTITCPTDATVACGESTLPANTGTATASANCGFTTISYTDGPIPASCLCNYSFVRTWKATDACGNQSTCTQNITVSGPVLTCSIVATPSNTTYTGGVATNLYLGYGPQSATLSVNTTSGSNFTYVWSGPTGLDCYNCANPVFTPATGGSYTFNVTVTNEYGCSSSCSVTFCVKDIRVPGTNEKVYLCHVPNGNMANASTSSVSVNAVPSHLSGHTGDKLGRCDQLCGSVITSRMIAAQESGEFRVFPNPNNGAFTVQLPDFEGQSQIQVSDVQGKVIVKQNVAENTSRTINLNLGDIARGVYFIEVSNGEQRFRTRLIVQ